MRCLISSSCSGKTEAEDLDGAAIGGNQAGEHADGGGLARAVGAEEAEEGAARHFEIHAIDGGFQSVDFLRSRTRMAGDASDINGRRSF